MCPHLARRESAAGRFAYCEVRAHIERGKLGAATPAAGQARPRWVSSLTLTLLPRRSWWSEPVGRSGHAMKYARRLVRRESGSAALAAGYPPPRWASPTGFRVPLAGPGARRLPGRFARAAKCAHLAPVSSTPQPRAVGEMLAHLARRESGSAVPTAFHPCCFPCPPRLASSF